MCGALTLVRRRRGRTARGARRRTAGVAGGDGAGEDGVVLDQAGAGVREPLRQQLLRRYVLEGGVADPAAPVGERDAARLDEAVQVAHVARLGQVGALQDVERLPDRRAAGGRGRHGVDAETAVGGLRRRLELRAVGREVAPGQVAGACVPAGRRIHGRLVDRAHDVAGDVTPVQGVDALAAQLAVGAGQVGVLEGGADGGEFAARQEQLGGVGEVPEAGLVGGGLRAEGLVDGEAVAGEALGGPEDRSEASLAPSVERALPGGGGAGRADGQSAADRLGEQDRRAVLQEEAGVGGERGGLAAVEGVHGAGPGVVVDEVAASADTGRVGLGDAERGGRGHGGVGGVAALAQHLDAGGGRVGVDAGDGAAVADGHRRLGRRSGVKGFFVVGGRRRGRSHRDDGGGDREDREFPCDRATHPHLQ